MTDKTKGISSYYEKMISQINPCFYKDLISPDLVISYSGGFNLEAKNMVQQYPNIQYLVNHTADSQAVRHQLQAGIAPFSTVTESSDKAMSLATVLDFYSEYIETLKANDSRVSIVIEITNTLAKAVESTDVSSLEEYINELKREIAEEFMEYDVEDLDEEGYDVFIAFSDFFLPSTVKKIPEKVHHELTRTMMFKEYVKKYVEPNSLSFSEPRVLMDYLVNSRAKASTALATFNYNFERHGSHINAFGLSEKDVHLMSKSFTEEVYLDKYIPSKYLYSIKQKNFKVNFPFYFNLLVKF